MGAPFLPRVCTGRVLLDAECVSKIDGVSPPNQCYNYGCDLEQKHKQLIDVKLMKAPWLLRRASHRHSELEECTGGSGGRVPHHVDKHGAKRGCDLLDPQWRWVELGQNQCLLTPGISCQVSPRKSLEINTEAAPTTLSVQARRLLSPHTALWGHVTELWPRECGVLVFSLCLLIGGCVQRPPGGGLSGPWDSRHGRCS